MSAIGRIFVVLLCASSCALAQLPDQLAAARVLGPHWKQMARKAGLVFSGTVVAVEAQPRAPQQQIPVVRTRFRVNRAVAGTKSGEVVEIREWAGLQPSQRSLSVGQRVLIFLYPPSTLGLTSPVGGPAGQIILDSRGNLPIADYGASPRHIGGLEGRRVSVQGKSVVRVAQLERAIRAARAGRE